jgi:tetratricopeptide (TPR) repeat protein
MKKTIQILKFFVLVFLAMTAAWRCSVNKDAFMNRTYHGMTAKYNGYFNANELLTMAVLSFEKNRKDDFYDWLPVLVIPTKEESKSMHSAIDTAIKKCTKVIQNHAMPSADGPKEAEYNPWIDENWLTIGRAYYYRGDYEKSLKNFQFTKRFFPKDPSKYIAELWMAKIYLQQNRIAEAKTILDELQKTALTQKKKTLWSRFSQKNKVPKSDDNYVPEMNQKIQYEMYKTRASLYLLKKQPDEVIFPLSQAVDICRNKRERARLSFILGQMYLSISRLDSARIAFKNAVFPSADYDIAFNGKLNYAVLGTSDKDQKSLDKMLRDEKNAAYKDQIFYAKAQMELGRGNTPIAIAYYTLSAFYSTKNQRQKALSYERLGDLSFQERSYLNAQKYYDSCAKAMPENYPNADGILSKVAKLGSLVNAIEIAQYEDSVQRIAKMDEKSQTAFIKDVIKHIKDEAQRKKELEAAKLRALQDQANAGSQFGEGNKWIFNNEKLRQQGFDEFRKLWGDRKNEDDWRRSNKLSSGNNASSYMPEDSLLVSSPNTESEQDTLDVESLRKRLPLSDSAYSASVLREIEARYTTGNLYKELLNEPLLASEQFKQVLAENTRNITDLSSAFQLYKINESSGQAQTYKTHIINYYPKSDAANYFLDPDFFEKSKAARGAAEKEYLTALHEYEMMEYKKAFDLTEKVVVYDRNNAYRAEYLLLNALAFGQITSDKKAIIPRLNILVEEKPGTPQADRAKELLEILAKGVSSFTPYQPKSNGIFKFNDTIVQLVLILPDMDAEEDFDDLKSTVSDFTTKNFKKSKLKITSALTLKGASLLLVADFKTLTLAREYVNTYKSSIDELENYQNNKCLIITQENLKKLIESDNFEEYITFHDLNY